MNKHSKFLILIFIIGVIFLGYFFINQTSFVGVYNEVFDVVNDSMPHSNILLENQLVLGEEPTNQDLSPKVSDLEITDCLTINSPGYYSLSNDIESAEEVCVLIENTSFVRINCKNHTVEGEPSLGILASSDIEIKNCYFEGREGSLYGENSENIIVSDSKFNTKLLGGKAEIGFNNSENIFFINNLVYGQYTQNFTSGSKILNNVFIFPSNYDRTTSSLITTTHGSNNQVSGNNIDGGSDGVYKNDSNENIGADDGIIVADEIDSIVSENEIKDVWDCGIETVHRVENIIFKNNHTSNNGICGIGGWYWSDLIGNTFEGNTIEDTKLAFLFNRSGGLLPEMESFGHVLPARKKAYFKDNLFKKNVFREPRDVRPAALFEIRSQESEDGGYPGGKPLFEEDIIYGGNIFIDNDFGLISEAPRVYPEDLVSIDQGNTCGEKGSQNFFTLNCN